MKRNCISIFMAIALVVSGAAFCSCEKDPQKGGGSGGNGGNGGNTENPGGGGQGGSQATGDVINVKAGEDLQAAINSAKSGMTIRVQGGATFNGNFYFVEGVNLSGGWNSTFTKCTAEDLDNLTVLNAKGNGMVLTQYREKIDGTEEYVNWETPTTVSGFEITGGYAEKGAGAWLRHNAIMEYCYIHDNRTTSNGGGLQVDGGAIVRHCDISNNESGANGGGAYISGGLVEECELTFNKANNNCGGGAQIHGAGQLINCIIAKNSAKNGGGVRVYSNDGLIAGCLITGNTSNDTSKSGGSGLVLNGNCRVINCTIVSNSSVLPPDGDYAGAGLYFGSNSSDSPVKHCVVWGNNMSGDVTVRQVKGSRTIVEHCAIAGGDDNDPWVIDLSYTNSAATGTDGVNTWERPAPGFVAPSSNIFRLLATSVLIDKGDNANLPEGYTKDLDGEARISGGKVDLGAFEYQK